MTPEIYTQFVWFWIMVAVIIFIVLLFITAPYGRHSKTTWGPMIDNRAGWVIMEVFVLVVLYYFLFNGTVSQYYPGWLMLAFFTFHYLNRSLVFPFRLKTSGKKMPVLIMLMGMTFNLVNGFIIGYYFGNLRVYDASWLLSFPFIAGTIVFFTGLIINWQSDTILIHLRKSGEKGYKIPYGKMFRFVSCPNLFGEVLEWGGFALLTWSLPGFAFFIWSAANLIPRAIAHHNWYRRHFAAYPSGRKVIFPGIF